MIEWLGNLRVRWGCRGLEVGGGCRGDMSGRGRNVSWKVGRSYVETSLRKPTFYKLKLRHLCICLFIF